jgi:hypothetical protein
MKLRLAARLRAVGLRATLLAAGFAAYSTTGCLSNQYQIPKDELTRMVQLPPAARGERVRVLQQLGEREGEPVPPGGPRPVYVGAPLPAEPPPPVVVESEPSIYFETGFDFPVPRPTPAAPARGHWRAPSPGSPSGGGGGAVGKVGGAALKGGGGGGKGEEVAVLAVVVAVVAMFAVVGLAVSEGARFDGYTQLRPEQPVHLKNARGQELHVPLAALTAEDVAVATEATVRDDEGFGLHLLDRRPLDRVGATFKVSVGSLVEPPPAATPQQEWMSGVASTIQVGGFVNRRLGFLGSLALAGGSDAAGHTFQRHGLSAETQFFPLLAGPLALGAFGHAGMALAGDSESGLVSGPLLGGGALLELALSTRLAFALRGDWSAMRLDDWSNHVSITAGLSIY